MRLAAGCCLLLGLAAPARAEWEGFAWGMSEAEVEAATSDIAVYRHETRKQRKTYPSVSTLGGIWTRDGHAYELSFYFDSDSRLRDIDLQPKLVECPRQNDVFAERFGQFDEDVSQLGPARRSVRRWRLGDDAELMTTVLHFPSDDGWICSATIKKPVGP